MNIEISTFRRARLPISLILSTFGIVAIPATAQDDGMIAAIKSIWPDRQIEVLHAEDDSLGNVTLSNYGTSIVEGNNEYQIAVAIAPDNAPADVIELLNATRSDAATIDIESIGATGSISPARDSIIVTEQGRRENIHVMQNIDFRCVDSNIYVSTSVLRNKGTSTADPTSHDPESAYTKRWNQALEPLSRDFAERAASAICDSKCNTRRIRKFYASYLDIGNVGWEFAEKFAEGAHRAFDEYPSNCPAQTKLSMLQLISQGFDAPAKMWEITARRNAFQEDRGTPAEYNKFVRSLGAKMGMSDPAVRRFVHYPRKKDLLYAIGRKLDKPIKEIMLHVLTGQINKISSRITEHTIDAAALVLLDEDNISLVDPETLKYYVDVINFTNSSLDPKAENHDILLEYGAFAAKHSGWTRLESGVGVVKEALFFIPKLIELHNIYLENAFVDRTFDELQASFPGARRDYERSLARLGLVRFAMRDSLALWKRLQERNRGVALASWPPDDQEKAFELVGRINRNQSYFARLAKAHGVLFDELTRMKDAFVLTWHLLGYPDDSLPPMEAIY